MTQVPRSGGKFLRAKDLKVGDTAKITSEADWEDSDYGKQYVSKVEYNGEEVKLKYTMASCTEISGIYGADSKDWVGKTIKLEAIKVMVGGQVKLSILAYPSEINSANELQNAWDEA